MECEMRAKIILWITLSVSVSVASYFIHRLVIAIKRRRAAKKFSDPRYRVGSALVNMERAISYGDGENFKFFARYAIRACLGMPNAYPPDEPPEEDIRRKMETMRFDTATVEKVMKIYRAVTLPDDTAEWKQLREDVRAISDELLIRERTREQGDA
ncbi:MAG: hypothetical protein LBT64_02550 [Puniceicoccales bacterium]|jgi:hypothetical protein|nr:hypothetical protein [Puniceicoccales bacterium]